MKRKDSTFFIAYLGFLFFCILCKFANQFLNLPMIDSLDNLVIAVSISSFLFTASDMCSSGIRQDKYYHDKVDESSEYIIALLDYYINKFESIENLPQDKKIALNILKEDKEKRSKEHKHKANDEHNSVVAILLDISGFLVFLICLVFSTVSNFLKPAQDILTLAAFFMMLMNSYINDQHERQVESIVEKNRLTSFELKCFCSQFFDDEGNMKQNKQQGLLKNE